MATITMEEAQATLPDWIHRLIPGETLQITEDGRPVAVVTSASISPGLSEPRKLGNQAGSVLSMAPDFDAPLEDMKEYMEPDR